MKWYSVISLGALGGMCPSISKLAATYSTNPQTDLPVLGVYIGLGLFALLGSIVALGFGVKEARSAIVAGIAAPAIVTNVMAGAEKKPIPVVVGEVSSATRWGGLLSNIVSPLFAQMDTNETQGGESRPTGSGVGYVNIVPTVIGGELLSKDAVTYEWAGGDDLLGGSHIEMQAIDPSVKQSLEIPSGATGILINGKFVPLPEAENELPTIKLEIETRPTFLGDLKWALGGQRNYEVENIEVVPSKLD